MPFRHQTIGQLLDELAREVPSLPAGGCVLALLGALASALQRFVASVARHRRNNPDVDKRLKEMISRLETLQDKCIELMDQDLAAYQKIIRITHMQENKVSAQSNRQKAIQETRIRAAQPPVILMELAAEERGGSLPEGQGCIKKATVVRNFRQRLLFALTDQ